MGWFKKLFNKLEGKNEELHDNEEERKPRKEPIQQWVTEEGEMVLDSLQKKKGDATVLVEEEGEIIPLKAVQQTTGGKESIDVSNKTVSGNIIELEEVTIQGIVRKMKVLSYADTKITGIVFHFRKGKNSPDSLAGTELFKAGSFRQKLFIELDNSAIKYDPEFTLKLIYNSETIDHHTLANANTSFELLTPATVKIRKFNAVFKIIMGIAWEEQYVFEPVTDKDYFIGRGKTPQLDNGIVIENSIAFISVGERKEEQYLINNHISRSMALVYYDEELNEYLIKRSGLMNNSGHVLKVVSVTREGIVTNNLNHSNIVHVLKEGDNIIVNDKISMKFHKEAIEDDK